MNTKHALNGPILLWIHIVVACWVSLVDAPQSISDNNNCRNHEVLITAIPGVCQSIIDYEEQRSEICSVLRSEI